MADNYVKCTRTEDGFQINISGALADQFDVEALQGCLNTFASCSANSDCVGTLTKSFGGFCGAGNEACGTGGVQLISALCGYKGA